MTNPRGELARLLIANWLKRQNGVAPRPAVPAAAGVQTLPRPLAKAQAAAPSQNLLASLSLQAADPAHAHVLQTAKEHLEAGRAEEARQMLMERGKSGRPAMSRDAWYLMAVAEAETGRYQASLDTLAEMVRVWPNDTMVQEAMRQVTAKRAEVSKWARVRYFRDRADYMDYPKAVAIETTGRCNAKCDFCPHETLDRRNTAMDDELFLKILDDLKAVPPHINFRICPYFINEPFMDKKIFDRFDLINAHLPTAGIEINTNLNFLPKNFFERMKNVKNIRTFRASVFSLDKEEYESVYKISHDRTMKNLLALLEFNRKERVIRYPILVSRVKTGDDRDQAFVAGVGEMLKDYRKGTDYVILTAQPAHGVFDGDLSFGACEGRKIPFHETCENWFKLWITATGSVALCCFDPEAKYAIGDARTQNVLTIYNSGWFRSMRETAFSRETVYPCNKCDFGLHFGEIDYGEGGLMGLLAENMTRNLA